MTGTGVFAYVAGFGVLAASWVLHRILAGTWDPWKLVMGVDGRPSSSKFQWCLWTITVISSYSVIYAARMRRGQFEALAEIPPNLLIVVGLSVTTMVAAKGIHRRLRDERPAGETRRRPQDGRPRGDLSERPRAA